MSQEFNNNTPCPSQSMDYWYRSCQSGTNLGFDTGGGVLLLQPWQRHSRALIPSVEVERIYRRIPHPIFDLRSQYSSGRDPGHTHTHNRNIRRAQSAWGKLWRILSREGAKPNMMATIYKAVVQAVLRYGAESWVLSLAMEKKLNSFHHCCAPYITGQHIRQNPDESWTCPSSESSEGCMCPRNVP
jgi:hypothetical protein